MQRIGVFGASFNPPTLGHQNVIEQAAATFDKILLVPSVAHAFNKQLISLEHRLAMLQLLVDFWTNHPISKQLEICNIEQKMQQHQAGAIYTFDVLTELTEDYAAKRMPTQIQFIIGPDNCQPAVWQRFYRYQEIEKKWPLFIAQEQIPIHSTLVREILSEYNADPVTLLHKLLPLVPTPIAHYILQHHLYEGKFNGN